MEFTFEYEDDSILATSGGTCTPEVQSFGEVRTLVTEAFPQATYLWVFAPDGSTAEFNLVAA